MSQQLLDAARVSSHGAVPRVGFVGVGWIGRNRMAAMVASGAIEVVAIADALPATAAEAASLAPKAKLVSSLDAVLREGVDGVVIATPNALHAEQAIQALGSGAAVFCQKPLGRTEAEVRAVVNAARGADRLLGVDLSYRFTTAMGRVRDVARSGELGRIYAVDLVFHNAYGPDKAWFYQPEQSGGGCVMDLGVHLVDIALWTLDDRVAEVNSTLFAQGERLGQRGHRVEDYAAATLQLETGTIVRLVCSWGLQAGCDAMISAAFYGTQGGARLCNVNGSFYDFTAESYRGTAREVLATPPDDWGGRAAVDWAVRLGAGQRFAPAIEQVAEVARVLDRIYGR